MWFNYKFWLEEAKVKMVFSRLGYHIETVRCYLKREFGYKNGEEIEKDLGVKKSFLDLRLAYKDFEVEDLNKRLALLLEKIRGSTGWWAKNSSAITMSISESYNIEDTAGKYELKHRFGKILEEILEIDPGYYL